MKPFLCPTENFIKSEKTEITADVSAGSAVEVAVKNNQKYAENDFCIFGIEGSEGAKVVKISSVAGNTTITFATVKLAHLKGAPITKIRYNRRKFYGCVTKTGIFIYISINDIEVDNPKGTYFEYTGVEGYLYFKATYYNSVTLEESDIDDAIAVRAGAVDHYCSVYDIREEAGFVNNPYIGDGRIHAKRLAAEAEVKSSVAAIYSLPLSAECEIVGVITKTLAAGWLMWAEYGEEASGTSKDGMAKVEEARSMLKAIRNGSLPLLDASDSEPSKISSPLNQMDGWPDETTEDEDEDDSGGAIRFRIKKKF